MNNKGIWLAIQKLKIQVVGHDVISKQRLPILQSLESIYGLELFGVFSPPIIQSIVSLDQTSSFGIDDSTYEDFDVVEEKVTISSGNMKCEDEKNDDVVCRTNTSIEHLNQKILGCSSTKRREVQCTFDVSGIMRKTEKSNSKSVLQKSCDNEKHVVEMKGRAAIIVDLPFGEGQGVNMTMLQEDHLKCSVHKEEADPAANMLTCWIYKAIFS